LAPSQRRDLHRSAFGGIAAAPAAPQRAEIPRRSAVVPDGMAALSDTLTGSYFARKPLKR